MFNVMFKKQLEAMVRKNNRLFTFDKEKHIYTEKSTGINIESGSYIANIGKEFVSNEYLDYAIKQGIKVHKIIELASKGFQLTEIMQQWDLSDYYKRYLNYLHDKGYEVFLSEFKVFDQENKIAGTIDLLLYDLKRDRLILCDVKTSDPKDSHFKQLLIYKKMVENALEIKIDKCLVLTAKPNVMKGKFLPVAKNILLNVEIKKLLQGVKERYEAKMSKIYEMLYPYQKEIIDSIKRKRLSKIGLFLDTGTGKTLVSLCLYQEMFLKDKMTLLCLNSKKLDWYRDIKKHFPSKKVLVFDKTSSRDLKNFEMEDWDIIVINWERLRKREKVWSWISKSFVIFDESHKMGKSKDTILFRTLNKIKIEKIALLTATPVIRSREWYHHLKILGLKITKKRFDNLYFNKNIDKQIKVQGETINLYSYETKEAFYKMYNYISKDMYFIKFEDVFPQIKKKEQIHFIKNAYQQEYNHLIEKGTFEFEELKDKIIDTGILLYLHLKQFSSGFISKKKGTNLDNYFYKLEKNPKIEYLKDMLEADNNNYIIFYNYDFERQMIETLLNELNIKFFNQYSGKKESYEALSCEERNVLIVQYMSGAEGLNLQSKYNQVIYFGLSNQYILHYQAKNRIFRAGQKNKSFIHYFVMEDTIDEEEIDKLEIGKESHYKIFKKNLIKKLDKVIEEKNFDIKNKISI